MDLSWRQRFDVAWRMLRPFTLTASLVPTLVGTGLAMAQHHFRPGEFLAFILASVLIQSATNMFNEYFDYRRGLDSEEMVGISGTIVRDGIRPAVVLRTAWTLVGVSILLGLYICATTSWWVAVVGVCCIAVAYFYSGGPKPLAYTPFGEIAAAVSMGPTIVLLAYYIETGHISPSAWAASVPIGLLIGAILLGNNIRDMEQDRAGGRHTVPILMGRERGRMLVALVFTLAYALTLGFVLLGYLTPWALLVLLTIPSAVYVVKLFYRYSDPVKLHPAVKGTSVLLFRFGALMFAGLLAAAWFPIR
ncbi:MAG: 1,4-dihydroxy-2-naphthoate polyprenyltransferase [Alicyclobacillus macrosporangiidus]|uniref:1,4-dihydroxy-2-naphthoate polyprenyltransferase n=1 Tax=Alicyclobacillus macrosporangiidus TaxID=392015 RepID=UPI0026EA7CB9|nr:1,4-dihydroxy-2-naphthoate polyprenyltransferase [Alicyclobacillus macrosporangiidus]MCL6598096.1 1,4-dihydroxy-2-naphthoate polyprenyltransferase [Alicyclobacillus macrosporangiidus]